MINEALRLTFREPLRAYDAVQLATSLVASRDLDRSRFVFVTADEKLAAVSRTKGLQTDNPTDH